MYGIMINKHTTNFIAAHLNDMLEPAHQTVYVVNEGDEPNAVMTLDEFCETYEPRTWLFTRVTPALKARVAAASSEA